MKRYSIHKIAGLLLLSLISVQTFGQTEYTRGIGIYPGRPQEGYIPQLVSDNTYRNIALNRAMYQSPSYDYNLTAQLLTDGIIDRTPVFLEVLTPQGNLPKREREWSIDGGEYSRNILSGGQTYLSYIMHGYGITFDQVAVCMQVAYQEKEATKGHKIFLRDIKTGKIRNLSAGDDLPGKRAQWLVHSDPNKQTGEATLPFQNIEMKVDMDEPWTVSNLSLEMQMAGAAYWTVFEVKFFLNGKEVSLLPSNHFCSMWMSDNTPQQWVYVDLGNPSDIHEIIPYWVSKPRTGSIQVSDDAEQWRTITKLGGDSVYRCREHARYVRLLFDESSNTPYALSELVVMGRGGTKTIPCEAPKASSGKLLLNGGAWKLCRASQVTGITGEQLSSPGYDDSQWIIATVPATVVTSYVNNGALPNPNYDNNLFLQSESYFRSNFWYRRTFTLPEEFSKKHVILNFDGINWKANIYLNGKKIDRIEGAFMRGKTDITDHLLPGENILAVEVICNDNYAAVKEKNEVNTDFNGGTLGADNPTFHATVGWDWISTLRGRDMGIWNDVYLTAKGSVEVSDPLVSSTLNLPDTLATLTPRVFVTNHEQTAIEGTLRMWVGNIRCEKNVRLTPGEKREVVFSPNDYPQLKDRRLRLWWPNGYGAPYRYEAGCSFMVDGEQTDAIRFYTGIRDVRYQDKDTALKIFVNGKRFIPLGGNWGFSENHLNYRAREYDIAVGYHRDMNFTMIRNWVGQTGDEEFYDACDRYGIMVWQDFWLANPADGPDPKDEEMFVRNAKDYVYRIRQHPCIALYCGRNEGYPPAMLNEQLKDLVAQQHPGMLYIPSSADDGVSGHGPYSALTAKEYFNKATPKLHTERGMPNVMTFEGLSRTLRKEHLWPQNNFWGQHDFTMQGAQKGSTFNLLTEQALGASSDAAEFTAKAQWINYNGYRAMYESNHQTRSGLLIWMSHPAFPSMTWQTYDYYFEPTAAYFACKKACEPLHMQWNAATDSIQLVNLYVDNCKTMTATAEILDMYGKPVWKQTMKVRPMADSTTNLMLLPKERLTTDVGFVRLSLTDLHSKSLYNNIYVFGKEENNYQALNNLPKTAIKQTIQSRGNTSMRVALKNTGKVPALMVRLNLVGEDGEQILPVHYSDNYFHLMPGEEKWVDISWKKEDARGMDVSVQVSGYHQR